MAATVVPDRGRNVGSCASEDRSTASSPSPSASLANDVDAAAWDDVVVVLLFVCVSGAGGCGVGCGAWAGAGDAAAVGAAAAAAVDEEKKPPRGVRGRGTVGWATGFVSGVGVAVVVFRCAAGNGCGVDTAEGGSSC